LWIEERSNYPLAMSVDGFGEGFRFTAHVSTSEENVRSGVVYLQSELNSGITHATLPPAVLAALPDNADLSSVDTLILAGDVLAKGVADRWEMGRCLINAYGPTEETVCATLYIYRDSESYTVPIGRPIANVQIYILDERREPVAIGVIGELYIGGIGVACGYFNRPELTAEHFVHDPFLKKANARMYESGDLARWRPGRNDRVSRAA
jgi:non-ribosomal peptide synthetase component F